MATILVAGDFMQTILREAAFTLRQLRKSKGFTLIAVLTLALGIGANVAVFSVMNAVLLNPRGVPHPQRLITERVTYQKIGLINIGVSAPDFGDLASGNDVVSSAAAMRMASYNLSGDGTTPERLIGAMVTWQWFNVFEAKPVLGRVFRPEEDMPEANREVVLSYGAWTRRFGADPSIVGRTIQLNRQSYQVVGVMGKEFGWPNQAEIWVPLGLPPGRFHDNQGYRYNENMFAIARLRDGATVEQASAFLRTKNQQEIASEGQHSFGETAGWGMFAMPLVDFAAGEMRRPLMILLAAVGTVLLIACANIAGLQLARASGRHREIAVRIALGAGRGNLVRHALVESVLLSAGGFVLGLIVAKLTIPLLLMLAPDSLAQNLTITLGGPVFWYIAAASIVCAILCGAAPAWQMTHLPWFQALQEGGRSEATSPVRQRLRSTLVTAEIALAMLLIVGAGLLVRSLGAVERLDTGFDPQGTLSASLSLPAQTYDSDVKQAAFFSELQERVKNTPGVVSVGMVDALPFSNGGGSASFTIVGEVRAANDPGPHGNIRAVSPDYFSAMRIPLVRGRVFTPEDRIGSQPVALVDETLAARYWPGKDPIGQQIRFSSNAPTMTIVGIVKHARIAALESDTGEGFYYLSMAQQPQPEAGIVVRTSGLSPVSLRQPLEAAVHALDPSQPIYDVKTMEQRVNDSLVGRRFLVILLSIFAGLALLLAALGLYGVVSYGVSMRSRELGVRMALGAQRGDVLRLILSQGLKLALVGVGLGTFATFAFGRVFGNLLYQVKPWNPETLGTAAALLTGTVLMASYLPARRASHLDPMKSIRDE
jgi:predicted permease